MRSFWKSGSGGRLDTTNVVAKPALTIITSISMDHTQLLGDTIELIAAEKAGIMKRDVPCVIAPQTDEVMDVLRSAARKARAPVIAAGEHFTIFSQHGRLIVQGDDHLMDLPMPALMGPHQLENAGTAAVAAQQVSALLGITDEAIARGLQEVRWPARMQRLTAGRLAGLLESGSELWLDGGHNPDAARVVASTLADLEERNSRPLWLVTAMLKTKDAVGYFAPFRGLAQHVICVGIPGDDGASEPQALATAAQSAGLEAMTAAGVTEAIAMAQLQTGRSVRILLCGSLHFAGHVLALDDGVTAHKN